MVRFIVGMLAMISSFATPAHDNAVLLPSHYMADSHGYEWLIGPDKALDPR